MGRLSIRDVADALPGFDVSRAATSDSFEVRAYHVLTVDRRISKAELRRVAARFLKKIGAK